MRRRIKLLLVFLALTGIVAIGCQSSRNLREPGPLTRSEALELAVALANEKCREKHNASPFDAKWYPIEFDGSRWHWGGYDPAGRGGYSAEVSFDAQGGERKVQVYLSTDRVEPQGAEVFRDD